MTRRLALVHWWWKMAARMRKMRMTRSWIARAARVRDFPRVCLECVDEGFAERATPRELRSSTMAIRAPKVRRTRVGGRGEWWGM